MLVPVVTSKLVDQSGSANTGADVSATCNARNAESCSVPHTNSVATKQMSDGLRNVCKVLNEAIVVIRKSHKLLHLLHIGGELPLKNSQDLIRVHRELSRAHYVPKVLDLRLAKFTIAKFGLLSVFMEMLQYPPEMLFMFSSTAAEHQQVVKRNQDELVHIVAKYIIHKAQECTWSIT